MNAIISSCISSPATKLKRYNSPCQWRTLKTWSFIPSSSATMLTRTSTMSMTKTSEPSSSNTISSIATTSISTPSSFEPMVSHPATSIRPISLGIPLVTHHILGIVGVIFWYLAFKYLILIHIDVDIIILGLMIAFFIIYEWFCGWSNYRPL